MARVLKLLGFLFVVGLVCTWVWRPASGTAAGKGASYLTVDDLVFHLNDAGMVTRVTNEPEWGAQHQERLEAAVTIHTSLTMPGGRLQWGSVLVFQLASFDAAERATFANGVYSRLSNPSIVVVGLANLVIVGDIDDQNWKRTAEFCEDLGGSFTMQATQSTESIKRLAKAAHVTSMLHTIRGQLHRYEKKKGQAPDLVREQWAPFLAEAFLPEAPSNPFSPPEVATLIVEATTPGDKGSSVDPQTAGWVWNSADKAFYAAGRDD